MKPAQAKKKAEPEVESQVTSGFPSPAEDYEEPALDLHALVVKNQPATFFMTADTDEMQRSGVQRGDILVVDRSAAPRMQSMVVLAHEGEFVVKRCVMCDGRMVVADDHGSINVTRESVWGVVTYIVRQM